MRVAPALAAILPVLACAGAGSDDTGTCPAGDPNCQAGEDARLATQEKEWVAAADGGKGRGKGVADVDTYSDPESCVGWAKRGECQTNPNFMLKKCKRSCKLHGSLEPPEGPEDSDPSCKNIKPPALCRPPQWKKCPERCKWLKAQNPCKRKEVPGGLQDTSIEAMFERILQSDWAQKYEPAVLNRDPWILYLGKLLEPEVADDLLKAIDDSGLEFAPSYELQAGHSQRRKSESVFCSNKRCTSDSRILAVHATVTNVTGLPLPAQEFLQVVKYRSGDFYVQHQDTSNEYGRSAAGHRIYTMFAYLSDVPPDSGGETAFPKLDLKVTPKKGAAVLWSNVQTKNPRFEDLRSNHEAVPLANSTWEDGTAVTKFGCNLWLYGYEWRSQWSQGCMNKDAGF